MIYTPALNLFLYNTIVSHLLNRAIHYANGLENQHSFWNYVPIIGEFMISKDPLVELFTEFNEFPRGMLNFYLLINGMALYPRAVKHISVRMFMTLVIIWNMFMLERIGSFEASLIWSMWKKKATSTIFVAVISCIFVMIVSHVILILDSINMLCDCIRATPRIKEPMQPIAAALLGATGERASP